MSRKRLALLLVPLAWAGIALAIVVGGGPNRETAAVAPASVETLAFPLDVVRRADGSLVFKESTDAIAVQIVGTDVLDAATSLAVFRHPWRPGDELPGALARELAPVRAYFGLDATRSRLLASGPRRARLYGIPGERRTVCVLATTNDYGFPDCMTVTAAGSVRIEPSDSGGISVYGVVPNDVTRVVLRLRHRSRSVRIGRNGFYALLTGVEVPAAVDLRTRRGHTYRWKVTPVDDVTSPLGVPLLP